MRGVAVTSKVWSTAPMNIGSITALNSAAKEVVGCADGSAGLACASSAPVVEEGRLPSEASPLPSHAAAACSATVVCSSSSRTQRS